MAVSVCLLSIAFHFRGRLIIRLATEKKVGHHSHPKMLITPGVEERVQDKCARLLRRTAVIFFFLREKSNCFQKKTIKCEWSSRAFEHSHPLRIDYPASKYQEIGSKKTKREPTACTALMSMFGVGMYNVQCIADKKEWALHYQHCCPSNFPSSSECHYLSSQS